MADFSQATLENWRSEFLQLLSFTVMAAVLIHKGAKKNVKPVIHSSDGTERETIRG